MNITYNGHTPEDYGWWLATRPVITPSEIEYDRYKIPGKMGELVSTYGTRGNAKISFTLHLKHTNIVQGKVVSRWLRESGHDLILSDEPNFRMEVLNANALSYGNIDDNYKRVEVEMELYPFKFDRYPTGDNFSIPDGTTKTLTLETDTCEPLYQYSANQNGSITVNDKVFNVFAGQNIYIDVRRKMAYTSGGVISTVNGNYEDLKLKDGTNTITTSAGVALTIVHSREGYII